MICSDFCMQGMDWGRAMECWDRLAVENYGYPLARTNWLLRLRKSKCFLIISECLASKQVVGGVPIM